MMCKETLQEIYSMWTVAIRERDEASQRLQNSLAELSQLQKLANDILLSQEQKVPHFSDHFTSSFASPLDFPIGNSSPAISDSCSYSSSTIVQNKKDFETGVLEMYGGRVLPEKGKLVQAVIEAGPLLESLLIAGPIPKWRNPPVQVSGKRPILSIYGGLDLDSGMLNQSFPSKRFSMMS